MNLLISIILNLVICLSSVNSESLVRGSKQSANAYLKIRDTIYTHADHILEIYLPKQIVYLHFKNGETLEFKCSTGNPKLEKGVETPEGIFVIKNKLRKAYSIQFDSTLMINWMGFYYNIGFHALEGMVYYKYLGRRISSHGCIRISREDSEYLFKIIEIGTPVFIHSGKSARVVSFADTKFNYKIYQGKDLLRITNHNLKSLYSGLYLHKRIPVVISSSNLTLKGLSLGLEEKIPPQLPPYMETQAYHLKRHLFDVIQIK